MTDLELLVALAQTPLGFAMGSPFIALVIAGLHHMWTNSPQTRRELRRKKRAKRATTRLALNSTINSINK
jgi:hypothetical protein